MGMSGYSSSLAQHADRLLAAAESLRTVPTDSRLVVACKHMVKHHNQDGQLLAQMFLFLIITHSELTNNYLSVTSYVLPYCFI